MARLVSHSLPFPPTVVPSPAPAEDASCNPALQRLAAARCVLLLQGPVGPFFDRLTRWLHTNGASVHRVILQAGDLHDCHAGVPIPYLGSLAQWPAFLDNTIRLLGVDAIVLFGQVRAHHAAAIELAGALGLPVVVLEEGYIRPGYVTMELGGVNGFSTTLERYRWRPDDGEPAVHTARPDSTEHQFRQMAWYACRHYWAQYWSRPISPHYRHHKETSIWAHSAYWVWSFLKKQWYLRGDERQVRELAGRAYFFVPLQHDGDSQITHHSPYVQNTEFIIEVLRSFARFAPTDARLVFRQHPHCRGSRGHGALIRALAVELGIGERVVHLVEGHTPTIIRHARGVVVINSTVGLQALMRQKPLKVLGDALYDRPGLSFQGPLDRFWAEGPAPAAEQTQAFIEALIGLTQVPCNVYGRADEPLHWTVTRPVGTPPPLP